MPTETMNTIAGEIEAHMNRSGIAKNRWYVGITSDVEKRLFGDHSVPRKDHWYISRPCATASDARTIEAAFHKAGCKGDGGGGDRSSSIVYAYVITQKTKE